ncbi:prolyl aminopeptidase [uncultured Friedmanniella sp.]|uniref:prolyl aminopeptidase n=1 Tax=uncultured Friedmanniella sp. TaxID=335381 RepID=UPI0035CC4084
MRHPPIEPYDSGLLEVGDGNRVYWETSGNPDGKPALVVHGGPGTGSRPGPRRSFDPARYRIVQFDQRGCGQSLPPASDPATDMSVNTTARLVRDMERLREHLDVDRWLLFGGSWGSTLSLVYAEQHPERVSEIVLIGVTTGRQSELDWLYRDVGRFFPEAWEQFRDALPTSDRDGDLVAAYARRMEHPDRAVREAAAAAWCAWEDAVLSQEEYGSASPYSGRVDDARLTFVRICSHYFANRCWLEDDQVFRDVGRLAAIPGVLLHGRLDLSGPAGHAWALHRAWPGSELTIFPGSGHKGSEAMGDALLEAIDRFSVGRCRT